MLGAAPAVFIVSVPCSALMIAPLGILVSSVIGTNLPLISIRTSPVAEPVNDLPSDGGAGAGAFGVVNVMSGPFVVPALLVATRRT